MRALEKYIPLLIFVGVFSAVLSYTLTEFAITSDSLREYYTYLTYVERGNHFWVPLDDNILSTALFTTYLPAMIQRVLQLPDAEVVYRISLAAMVSIAPTFLYIVIRRYTTNPVALLLVLLFATSLYFSISVSVARMIIGVTWVVALVNEIDSERPRRWLLLLYPVAGVLASHYTVALVTLGVTILATIIMTGTYAIRRAPLEGVKSLSIAALYMTVGVVLYYGIVAKVASVWKYSMYVIERVGIKLPPWVQRGAPVEIATGYVTKPIPDSLNGHSVRAPGPVYNHEAPRFNINPLKGERLDFVIAEVAIMLRAALAAVLVTRLVKRGEWGNPLIYLYVSGTLIALLGIWLPGIAQYMGSLRIGFIVLVIDILSIALWYREGGDGRAYIYAVLVYLIWFYH